MRQTLWAPALVVTAPPDRSEVPLTAPALSSTPAVAPHLAPTPKYGAMAAVSGWEQSRHKYSGKDFKTESVEA